MEKRKFKIDDINKEEKDKNKETYTFVIPNSKMEDISISVKKKDKNTKKDDHLK